MAGRPLAAGLAAVTLLGVLAACSGGHDAPTTSAAAPRLEKLMAELRSDLADDAPPLQPWRVSDDTTKDHASGCGDGSARRAYAATVVVPDTTGQDAEGREAKLLGKLGQSGWDPVTVAPKGGGVPSEVRGRRPHDSSGVRLLDRLHAGREGVALRGERPHRLPADVGLSDLSRRRRRPARRSRRCPPTRRSSP